MRNRLTQAAHEVARKTLNLEDVRSACVPFPPIGEQAEIVLEVDRRLSIVEEVEAQVEANMRRAARLRQGILKRAFEGRLVPQDPTDEPAEKLLERIRSERTGALPGLDGCTEPARRKRRSRVESRAKPTKSRSRGKPKGGAS